MRESDLDADIRKGKCTQDQLRIWDQLLEIRIQLQRITSEANTLPQSGFDKYDAQAEDGAVVDESSNTFSNVVKSSHESVWKLLDTLLDLQDAMVKQNPQIKMAGASKSKDSGSKSIDSDEEITSSEEGDSEDKDVSGEVDADGGSEDDGEEGEEENDDEEEEDDDAELAELEQEEEESEGVAGKRRKVMNDYEVEVQKRMEEFATFRNETIQKWNDKTQVASGNLKRNFAAFQTSTLTQVNHILKDPERLIKRTQLKRSQYNIIGKGERAEAESEYDPEIFDDDDFYHQLLRELIDRKTSKVTDPVQLSRHWLQIQKLRSKMKKNVDTRASKGRKIRYDVHPKLVNYMASYDNSEMTENAVNELMSSLFGNQK